MVRSDIGTLDRTATDTPGRNIAAVWRKPHPRVRANARSPAHLARARRLLHARL